MMGDAEIDFEVSEKHTAEEGGGGELKRKGHTLRKRQKRRSTKKKKKQKMWGCITQTEKRGTAEQAAEQAARPSPRGRRPKERSIRKR